MDKKTLLNRVKNDILNTLDYDFILPSDSPYFQSNETFKETMIQARKEISIADNNEKIIEKLEELRSAFLLGIWEESKNSFSDKSNSFKQSLKDFYFDSPITSPSTKVSQIEVSIIDRYNSEKSEPTFFSKFNDIVNKVFQRKEKTDLYESITPEELNKKSMPLCGKSGYQEILEKAKTIAQTYHLTGISIDGRCSTSEFKQFLENLNNGLDKGSKALGITPNCMGMNGDIAYHYLVNVTDFRGIFHSSQNKIGLSDFSKDKEGCSSTLVHEWTHALDSKIGFDLKKSLKASGFDDLKDEHSTFVTEFKNKTTRLNDSSESRRYELFKDFVSLSISKDPEALKTLQVAKRDSTLRGYWFETLGKEYFTLPQKTIDELHSDEAFRLIKNKVLKPGDFEQSRKIAEFLHEHAPDTYNEKIGLKIISSKETPFMTEAREMIQEMGDYKHIGVTKQMSTFENQDKVINAIKKITGIINGKWREIKDEQYYSTDVEIVARYVESQTHNKYTDNSNSMSSFSKPYHTKIDSEFEGRRVALFKECFGAESVKERDLSLNDKGPDYDSPDSKIERLFLNKIISTITLPGYGALYGFHHINKGAEFIVNKSIDTFNKMVTSFKNRENLNHLDKDSMTPNKEEKEKENNQSINISINSKVNKTKETSEKTIYANKI